MNNNSKAAAKRTQVVYSEPQFKKVGTKEKVCKNGKTVTIGIWKKNPNAKPIKEIVHATLPPFPATEKSPAFPGFNQFKRFKNR